MIGRAVAAALYWLQTDVREKNNIVAPSHGNTKGSVYIKQMCCMRMDICICVSLHKRISELVCGQLLFKAQSFETLLLWLVSCQSLSTFLRLWILVWKPVLLGSPCSQLAKKNWGLSHSYNQIHLTHVKGEQTRKNILQLNVSVSEKWWVKMSG